jgi:hypothetical protein
MPFANPFSSKKGVEEPVATPVSPRDADGEIAPVVNAATEDYPDKYVPDSEAQHGVKKVEAITLSWSRSELIIAYISYV